MALFFISIAHSLLLTNSPPDDVISDKVAMLWSKELNALFAEGRHICISVFITTQHVTGVGPLIRGNADVIVLQPIFQRDARDVLANYYGGYMDKKLFFQLMDDVVFDVNLEGSTPKDPIKRVRTMVINDYENTTNPQMKYHWLESEDPGEFKLLHPEYWKEQENNLGGGTKTITYTDPVEELEEIQALQKFKF